MPVGRTASPRDDSVQLAESLFDFAANELQAFCGASGVRVMPISGTRQMPSTPNAQRSTLNAQCLNGTTPISSVERWTLSVEKEPCRFLTPQHKFIVRPEEAPASAGLRAGSQSPWRFG